jgi:hypothetical protein
MSFHGSKRGAFEEHYSPKHLAKLWGVSPDTIRKLFDEEPGVFIVEREETRSKRRYRTMRIPASVAARVHARFVKTSVRAKME